MILQCEPLIGEAEKKAVAKYMESGGFLTEYVQTEKFERDIAHFLGVPYVSLVPSGSVAIMLALLASGIKPGDEVLVPDYTMVATIGAVRMIGAIPVLVDIRPESLCMDVSKAKVTPNTKALIYVEINGRAGDLQSVINFCEKNNLFLIEDSCQAFGSKYDNDDYLGTYGRFGCFSLSFHKLITTGQGGIIVSHIRKDYETIERWKDHGSIGEWMDRHDYFGFNFCFTDLQSVVGIEQLKTVKERQEKKRQIYKWYFDEEPEKGYVPWFMEYYVKDKKKAIKYFRDNGIITRSFYPPIHTQKIYQNAHCPVTEEISAHGIWLPSSLTLTKEQVIKVKEVLKKYENL